MSPTNKDNSEKTCLRKWQGCQSPNQLPTWVMNSIALSWPQLLTNLRRHLPAKIWPSTLKGASTRSSISNTKCLTGGRTLHSPQTYSKLQREPFSCMASSSTVWNKLCRGRSDWSKKTDLKGPYLRIAQIPRPKRALAVCMWRIWICQLRVSSEKTMWKYSLARWPIETRSAK